MPNAIDGINLYETVLQRIDPSLPETKDNTVTVLDVFNMLAKGMGTKMICKQRPEIKPETVSLARAFLIAKHPRLYDNHIAPGPDNNFRLLVDENISARVIPALRGGFSWATHTNFVGLNGAKDPEVWQWAVNNHIDAIVTRDQKMVCEEKDLTAIAIQNAKNILRRMEETGLDISLDELPLVVHITANKDISSTVAKIFKQHENNIHDYLETRSRPYIKVTHEGISEGPRYATLLQDQSKNPDIKDRAEQWVNNWTQKIVRNRPDGHKLSEDDIETIRQRVKDTVLPEILKARPDVRRTRSGMTLGPKGRQLP